MNDQDFFFDEEEKPQTKEAGSKPAVKKSAAAQPAVKKSAAAQPAVKKSAAAQPAVKKSAAAQPAVETAPAESSIPADLPFNIALLGIVIALLVGVIIGLFVGRGMATSPTGAASTGVVAPELTQEQISGGMPQDAIHKGIGGGSAAATATK